MRRVDEEEEEEKHFPSHLWRLFASATSACKRFSQSKLNCFGFSLLRSPKSFRVIEEFELCVSLVDRLASWAELI